MKRVGRKEEFLGCECDAAPKVRVESKDIDGVERAEVGLHVTGDGGDPDRKGLLEGVPKDQVIRAGPGRGLGVPRACEGEREAAGAVGDRRGEWRQRGLDARDFTQRLRREAGTDRWGKELRPAGRTDRRRGRQDGFECLASIGDGLVASEVFGADRLVPVLYPEMIGVQPAGCSELRWGDQRNGHVQGL